MSPERSVKDLFGPYIRRGGGGGSHERTPLRHEQGKIQGNLGRIISFEPRWPPEVLTQA
jgi:hypothetical protein